MGHSSTRQAKQRDHGLKIENEDILKFFCFNFYQRGAKNYISFPCIVSSYPNLQTGRVGQGL